MSVTIVGTFIYEDSNSTDSFSSYIVNTNSSFTSISESITGSGLYTHSIDYTFTDNGTTSDGLFLKEKNINILQFGNIPLVRDNTTEFGTYGSQFESFTGKISATDAPTILQDTSLERCFFNCKIASSDFGNINSWDVSNVTNMTQMFNVSDNFNQDLSNWDVSNVTDMSSMFKYALSFNQDISYWDVSSVTNMLSMFEGASSFNQNIPNWNVGSVTTMKYMFRSSTAFNGNLTNWDVSNVTDMNGMFISAVSFNGNITNWNVSSVTDMYSMFNKATSFNQDLSSWNVSSVTVMQNMFHEATSFNKDLPNWNVSNVTDMRQMFRGATSFNGNLTNWDVSNVTDMSFMFFNATAFNGNIISWEPINATTMNRMFFTASSFNQDISRWNVSNVTNFIRMFQNATVFDQNIRYWTVEPTDNLNQMFNGATAMQTTYSSVEGFANTPSYTFFNQVQPVCFLAGSIISTDQGDVKIEDIKKGYTINGIKVTGLSKQVFLRDKLILINKNCIDINIPNQDIYITPSHSIVHNGKLRECKKLALYNPELGLKYVKLDKAPVVYNVLCEKHIIMKCNNLEMETMSLNHADKTTHITYFN